MSDGSVTESREVPAPLQGYPPPAERPPLWVVAAFALGLLFAPRLSRFLAAIFSALAISDFLQIAYKAAEEKGLG